MLKISSETVLFSGFCFINSLFERCSKPYVGYLIEGIVLPPNFLYGMKHRIPIEPRVPVAQLLLLPLASIGNRK